MRGAAFVVCGLLTAGCSSGGGGDPVPQVEGDVLGSSKPLSVLNDPTILPRPSLTEATTVTGVRVTWIDSFDETKRGATGNVFVQDFGVTPGAYQGMLVFGPSYGPPNFRAIEGDVVDVTGVYQEFQPNATTSLGPLSTYRAGWTTPEIGGKITLRFDAPYEPIIPAQIQLTDLVQYETGRQWLSMLVTVENVTVFEPGKNSSGRFYVPLNPGNTSKITDFPTISNELFDLEGAQLNLKAGTKIAKLTGIVTLFDVFHIAPRSAADIQLQ